jgi:two-component system sensor histidine kinase BaeS
MPDCPGIEVSSDSGPWIGRLGLRLALVFVAVALAAVAAAVIFGSVAISRNDNQLISRQRADAVTATAVAAGAAYDHAGWARADLASLTMLVSRAGAAAQVRNKNGQVIHASPDFASKRGQPELTRPIILRGQHVGSVTLRFGHSGLAGAIEQFQSQRWPAWIMAASLAALIALITAVVVSHRISGSLDRLIRAARARGGGDRSARAGDVGGFGEIRELAAAFDQMADAWNQQDRLRRNLVADVAHELRTPIAVLQAGQEAMLDGLTKPTHGNLASLRDETLRLARMVDDLQRLASAEAAALQLTLAPANLAIIAQDAADRLADSFEAARLSLRLRLAETHVMCDPQRMREVTINLLTNALKFTPPGGSVLVETRPQGSRTQRALLVVSDTGVGIPPEDLPKVTERFFRSPQTSGYAGSGIGLTIVAEVVQGHHGTVDIASETGTGTKVTITLPAPPTPTLPGRRAKRKTRRDGDLTSTHERGKTNT